MLTVLGAAINVAVPLARVALAIRQADYIAKQMTARTIRSGRSPRPGAHIQETCHV